MAPLDKIWRGSPCGLHGFAIGMLQGIIPLAMKFRQLNAIDDFNRESLSIHVDTSLPFRHVVEVLDRIIDGWDMQLCIRHYSDFVK